MKLTDLQPENYISPELQFLAIEPYRPIAISPLEDPEEGGDDPIDPNVP